MSVAVGAISSESLAESEDPPTLSLTPKGEVILEGVSTNTGFTDAFSFGTAAGILALAEPSVVTNLSISMLFWRSFGREFLTWACSSLEEISEERVQVATEKGSTPQRPQLSRVRAESLMLAAPPMRGSEYLNAQTLENIWKLLTIEFERQLKQYGGSFRDFLRVKYAAWSEVGRVTFHLAENKESPDKPFAFLVTYITRLSSLGKALHLPLERALQEYSTRNDKQSLLSLLIPLQRAAEQSTFLRELLDSKEIFHPLAWTPKEASTFLKDAAIFEAAGILIRIPRWKSARAPRPTVKVSIGGKPAAQVGLATLVDFSVELVLGEDSLTASEIKAILNADQDLVRIRGDWVQVDSAQIKEALSFWQGIEKRAAHNGISFIEGVRLLSGAGSSGLSEELAPQTEQSFTRVEAGAWLGNMLTNLREPKAQEQTLTTLQTSLKATLRPYQISGVSWLWMLCSLKLGGCLADDMGLGKTIQILALLLLIKGQPKSKEQTGPATTVPSLLVVPASLIGNWKKEAARFAPSLKLLVLHSSEIELGEMSVLNEKRLKDYDLVVTTYGFVQRLPLFVEMAWNLVILDEAQAIKNHGAKQTKAVKSLKSEVRFALTGTPIENSTSDIWSLFDFINPGLLGSVKLFGAFIKKMQASNPPSFAALKNLVRPYILRRLKSDRSVISDLPNKTELPAYCTLSRAQATLYARCVKSLEEKIESTKGIARKGLVLSFLMQFKQICNHPAHWNGSGDYDPDDSGKFQRLRELCEEIAARQEKVLIFTQFRALTGVLAEFLGSVFKSPGLTLDGETQVKKRKDLVALFEEEQRFPFFVLSLKAGGVGLNLTAASHVIHFDRWWNPAVENQATDRAFRIGQKRNVLVHKFVCRGTIEERIDEMLTAKQSVAEEILGGTAEKALTEMNNEELLKFVSLDLTRSLGE